MYQERKFFAVLKPNSSTQKILVHDKQDGTFVYQYTDINAQYASYDAYYDCLEDALSSWQDDIDNTGWQEIFYFNSSKHDELPEHLTFLKEKAMIYFTSDLHFSHRNIAKFCPHTRPQGDIDTLDRYMIDVWNDTVGVDDIVYNLGDLSFSHDLKRITKVLSQLNGEHHLIFGNHDDIIQNHLDVLFKTKKHDDKPLLSSAQSYLKLKIEKQTLILFHYPIAEWDGCHKGYYHLHGHIHERMSDIQGRILNVGFDLHGRFLTLDDIQHYLDAITPSDHHFGDKADTNISPIYGLNVPDILTQGADYQSVKNDEQITNNQQSLNFLIAEHFKRLNEKT